MCLHESVIILNVDWLVRRIFAAGAYSHSENFLSKSINFNSIQNFVFKRMSVVNHVVKSIIKCYFV